MFEACTERERERDNQAVLSVFSDETDGIIDGEQTAVGDSPRGMNGGVIVLVENESRTYPMQVIARKHTKCCIEMAAKERGIC